MFLSNFYVSLIIREFLMQFSRKVKKYLYENKKQTTYLRVMMA